ncbi:MAG: glycosyltransferase, partial [Aquihabitans sp.]
EHNVWDSHHPATRLVDRITFGLDDAHLAVSEAVRASVPRSGVGRVEVVIHGVDVDSVLAEADRVEARRELGIRDDEVLIGTVANLRSQKAYPDLLRAARKVLDQVPTARFVAIGKGPAETELRTLHGELGLGDRFTFLGYRRDAAHLASGFDIFCMSSHHEGLPVALMEALVLGIPAVATTAGGIPELVTDRVEGRLVPTGRATELAAALAEVATDPAQLRRYADAAAKRGRSLSVDTAIRRTEDVYRALMESPSGSRP